MVKRGGDLFTAELATGFPHRCLIEPCPIRTVNRDAVGEQRPSADYPSSARSAFASSKSLVSKPSVNQP